MKYTKQVKKTTAKITKLKIIINDLFINQSNYEELTKPKYILKAETETTTEPKLVIRIETPLDTISIALQNRRKSNQKGLSK